MLKISVYVFACSLLLCSCTSAIKNDQAVPPDEVQAPKKIVSARQSVSAGNENLIVKNNEDLIGFWVGMFEPGTDAGAISAGEAFYWNYANKINISIDKIEQDKVWGHSVVAGNNRPFEGEIVFADNCYSFKIKEPGDNKYDGVFDFVVKKEDSLMVGTWHSYKPLKISKRQYALQKMLFHYNPELQMDNGRYIDWNKKGKNFTNKYRGEEGDYDESYFTTTQDISNYNASTQVLTSAEVSNLKKGDLFIIRNAIYARHGYSFKNQQLRVYFDKQPWYIPVSTDVKAEFTEIEKRNIELLLRYEKNAKEYYDVFGRG
jgi:hypothetical protein